MDIAAVIVIFAVFKGLRGIGLVKREFGMLESTIMMTVAVAASWISSAGLVSAVPALTMLTGYEFVWWQLTLFIAVILFLGLFMAIPLKRQMIQVDSLRFPANIPTGETLKAMYSHGGEAMKKAKALGIAGVLGMLIAGLRDGLAWIPAQLNLPCQIGRIGLDKLTLSVEPSLIFISIGALFGIKVGLSMLARPDPELRRPRAESDQRQDHPTCRAADPRGGRAQAAADRGGGPNPDGGAGGSQRPRPELVRRLPPPARSATPGANPRPIDKHRGNPARSIRADTCRTARPIRFSTSSAAGTVTNKATKATKVTQSLTLEAPGGDEMGGQAVHSRQTSRPKLVEALGFKPGAKRHAKPSAASATSAPGRCGPARRCWWSAACWRWPSNGGPWAGPSPASSPASGQPEERPERRAGSPRNSR